MKIYRAFLISLIAALGFASCTFPVANKPVQMFERGSFPAKLSDWSLLYIDGQAERRELVANDNVVPYDIQSALFTDYAHKFRTVFVPDGNAPAAQLSGGVYDLPVGSILSKTFYYPKTHEGLLKVRREALDFFERGLALSEIQLIETRLLVHTSEGWIGLPYVWNPEGTEAFLEVTGSQLDIEFSDTGEKFTYAVPDFNQCQGCHIENLTAGNMAPVGFKSHHLNKGYDYLHQTGNQLGHFASLGLIEDTSVAVSGLVDWRDKSASLEDRARSYLDINCGHCHNEVGPADTSGMFLTRATTEAIRLGVCKPPVAAGQGTGGHPVGINPGQADQSILSYRMNSLDLGAMMPELGRSLVHDEGVELISAWINELPGEC
jgi:uncharacterized repeat protein (TIGR03806 family)